MKIRHIFLAHPYYGREKNICHVLSDPTGNMVLCQVGENCRSGVKIHSAIRIFNQRKIQIFQESRYEPKHAALNKKRGYISRA